MDNNKQCKWISDDFTMVCVNDKSEHCADFVDDEICNKCKYYEKIQPYLIQYMCEWVNETDK